VDGLIVHTLSFSIRRCHSSSNKSRKFYLCSDDVELDWSRVKRPRATINVAPELGSAR
jgi:hypothetical protein